MEEIKMNEEKRKTLTIWALKRVKCGIINVKLQELLWSSTRPKAVDQISQLSDALLLRSLIPTDQTLVTTTLSKGYSVSSKIKKFNLIALSQMHTGGKYENLWIVLSNDHIVNLLLGCLALETMEFSCLKGFSRMEIRSSKLKRLNLTLYNDDEEIDHSLEIVTSYLHHLETSGSLHGLKCGLVDLSSMVNTKFTSRHYMYQRHVTCGIILDVFDGCNVEHKLSINHN
ncbi:hypothetical protein H5410_016541 [Solanum commersonii]|uniref:Uncharacterized protein n=1 Tax=Solanum commersonii TaxID=4109 RepID=A0A9J5ZWI5_SOLCO|nr:hypothetical protein H5410_016541 [Solanum commersonii]